MKFTLANIVTLSRLFIAPIFLVCILSESISNISAALILFAVGAGTDWLDGFLARRYGEVTDHGVFLDPLADKVLTTTAFVALFLLDIMPLWMLIVPVSAFKQTDARGTVMVTSRTAKVKTFLQMFFICYALLLYWLTKMGSDEVLHKWAYSTLYSLHTYIAIFCITMLTIFTAVMYTFTNRHLFARGS